MQLNFVLGTAAELIKMYPVIYQAIERGHQVRVLSTGQSRENFYMQYSDLNLPASVLSTLLESSGDLKRASSALHWFLRAIKLGRQTFKAKLLLGEHSYVLVHGDTLSTLVGSWQARCAGVPAVHIEAGLRSPHLLNPFPEEMTRRLVSRLAQVHLAPDRRAEANLRRAKVRGQVAQTDGNTLMDAVILSAKLAQPATPSTRFALVNIHRFENLNSRVRWEKILDAVTLAARDTRLVFVCHPQTQHKLNQDSAARARLSLPSIECRERMPFSEFIGLLKKADYLITDGGSNQEECSYLGKPCLILRETSERQEGLNSCCLLSHFDVNRIEKFLHDPKAYVTAPLDTNHGPSSKILDLLEARASIC